MYEVRYWQNTLRSDVPPQTFTIKTHAEAALVVSTLSYHSLKQFNQGYLGDYCDRYEIWHGDEETGEWVRD